MNELLKKSIPDLRKLLDAKEIKATEVLEAFSKRMEEQKELNTFISPMLDAAKDSAIEADQRIARNENVQMMTGIPIAIKDNICIKGHRVTAGSQFLKNFVSPYDATVIERLKDTGAVILGKTNCDEFAMGSSNENSSYGAVKNPWNKNCVPGGSSGGSAAVAAAGMAPTTLGSDTGGSIRQPSAFCGTVGLKTTYGRVSRYGLIAFASSLDQIGPISRRVVDASATYDAIAGYDARDSKSENVPFQSVTQKLAQVESLKGTIIGYPTDFLPEELSKEVKDHFFDTIKTCEKLGATIKEITLPHAMYGVSCYYVIAPAEASSNLARFDGIRYTTRSKEARSLAEIYAKSRSEGFGPEVKRRIMLGTFVLSSGYYDTYYGKALEMRERIRNDFDKAFQSVDFIVTPTAPSAAFELNKKNLTPLELYLADVFTVPVSIAGLPAISVPTAVTQSGLPLGTQIIGKMFTEAGLFETAQVLENHFRIYEELPE